MKVFPAVLLYVAIIGGLAGLQALSEVTPEPEWLGWARRIVGMAVLVYLFTIAVQWARSSGTDGRANRGAPMVFGILAVCTLSLAWPGDAGPTIFLVGAGYVAWMGFLEYYQLGPRTEKRANAPETAEHV